jgi:hypothetical protein
MSVVVSVNSKADTPAAAGPMRSASRADAVR